MFINLTINIQLEWGKTAIEDEKKFKFVSNQPVYAKITGFCPWPAKITYMFGRWFDVLFLAWFVIFFFDANLSQLNLLLLCI